MICTNFTQTFEYDVKVLTKSYKKESRLRDSPPAAGRLGDIQPYRRSAILPEGFYRIGRTLLYDKKRATVWLHTITLFHHAGDRNRTGTGGKSRRILSPVRLPVPPRRHSHIPFYFFPTVRTGWRRIRTFEVVDNRFTVCPLWPLGNPPMLFLSKRVLFYHRDIKKSRFFRKK